MKKRILSVFLAAIMVLGLFPVMVLALAVDRMQLGGVDLFDVMNASSDVVYFTNDGTTSVNIEPSTWNAKFVCTNATKNEYTLTVKNLSVSGTSASKYAGICAEAINLTIELEGANSVTGIENATGNSYGIYVGSGMLTISGSGALSVTGGTAGNDSCAIFTDELIVNSGTISATGGIGSEGSRGIFADFGMTVNGGTLNVTGSSSKYCRGVEIGSGNVLEVTGGVLVVTCGNGTVESYGISADEGVEAKGGVLVARAHGSETVKAVNGSLDHTNTKVAGGQSDGNAVVVVPATWADGSSLDLSSGSVTLDKDYYIVSTDATALALTNDTTIATNGNTLTAVSLFMGTTRTYGIEGPEYKLSIGGNGSVVAVGGITTAHAMASLGMGLDTLETTEGSAPSVTAIGGMALAPRTSSSAYSYGLSAATYTLRGGDLIAIGGMAWLESKGISCNLQNSKVISVLDGTVNSIGGAVVNGEGDSYGISGKTKISGGTVNAVAPNAPGGSYGIISGGVSVDISGGTVSATGGKYGLYSPGGTICNGNFTGGTAAVYSYNYVGARLSEGYGYYEGGTLLTPANTDTTVGSANQTVTVKALPHSHPVCGDSTCTSHGNAVTWTAWDGTGSTLGTSGQTKSVYFSASPSARTGDLTISGTANLCLNGKTLDLGATRIIVSSGATLNLCDCGSTGKITSSDRKTIQNKGTVNIYSGTVECTSTESGACAIDSESILNVTGGTVSATSGDGIGNTGSVSIGGTANVSAEDDGIYDTSETGTITVSGNARISGGDYGINNNYGGDITVSGNVRITGTKSRGIDNIDSNLTITGGTITGGNYGVAQGYAGNLSISGNTSISGTGQYGTGIYFYGTGTFTLSGAPAISGVESDWYRSDIYLSEGRTITIGEGGLSNTTPYSVSTASSPSVGSPDAITAGTETVDYSDKFTVVDADKYEITSLKTEGKYQVFLAKKPTPIAGTLTISGTAKYGEILTANYTGTETVTYQWYRGDEPISGATGQTYTLAVDDIGKVITVKTSGTNNYTGEKSASTASAVAKAALAVTAKPKTITYGDEPANDGVSYSGFVGNDNETGLNGTLRYEYDYIQFGSVGNYGITPKGLSSDRYEITFQEGTLTVESKEIGIDWSNTALTYNGAAQKPTAKATGTVNGDVLTLTVSGEQTDASATDYTATVTGIGGAKAGNYKLPNDKSTEFTISYLAAKPEMYTVIADYEKDGVYWFKVEDTVTVAAGTGYKISTAANGTFGDSVTFDKDDVFKVYIREEKTKAITDCIDLTSILMTDAFLPGGEIKIDERNVWQSFVNAVTFNLFFKDEKTATVTVNDYDECGIGSVEYFLADDIIDLSGSKDQTVAKLEVAVESSGGWKTYTAPVGLKGNAQNLFFAKITDNVGRVVYLNSQGIVLDSIAPRLHGIEDGGVYYGDKIFKALDDNFDKIEVDGQDVTDTSKGDDEYKIVADNAEHTVTVTDKADNVTEYKITVYKNYTVTFTVDGETLTTATVGYGKDATLPDIPSKTGYDKTAPVWDKDGKNITADTEINAVYTINEYTITFMDENGVYKTLIYKHGETVAMPEVPIKDGYTVQWETTLGKASGDAAIKAVYTEIPGADASVSPQTGDNSNLWLWVALAFAGGYVPLVILFFKNGRKKKQL